MSFFITFRAIVPILYSLKHQSIKGFVFRRYKIGAFFQKWIKYDCTKQFEKHKICFTGLSEPATGGIP